MLVKLVNTRTAGKQAAVCVCVAAGWQRPHPSAAGSNQRSSAAASDDVAEEESGAEGSAGGGGANNILMEDEEAANAKTQRLLRGEGNRHTRGRRTSQYAHTAAVPCNIRHPSHRPRSSLSLGLHLHLPQAACVHPCKRVPSYACAIRHACAGVLWHQPC